MSNYSVANAVVKMDRVCDFIPGLSTVTSAVNIIVKIALDIIAQIRPSIVENPYSRHLISKSYLVCFALMIPGVNFIVSCVIASRQPTKSVEQLSSRSTALRRLGHNPSLTKFADPRGKEMEEVNKTFSAWRERIQHYKEDCSPKDEVWKQIEETERLLNLFQDQFREVSQRAGCRSPVFFFDGVKNNYQIDTLLNNIANRLKATI